MPKLVLVAGSHFYDVACIYINKEELKTVGRDILACAQPNRHETFTALWNTYRRVSSRGRRAQIHFSRGARGEKPENDRPPFWFYGESIRTFVFNNTSQHTTPQCTVCTTTAAMPKWRTVLSCTTYAQLHWSDNCHRQLQRIWCFSATDSLNTFWCKHTFWIQEAPVSSKSLFCHVDQ